VVAAYSCNEPPALELEAARAGDLTRLGQFNNSGSFLLKFGSSGTGNGQFTNPNGIAIDGSGTKTMLRLS
jgi:hypothetical protein